MEKQETQLSVLSFLKRKSIPDERNRRISLVLSIVFLLTIGGFSTSKIIPIIQESINQKAYNSQQAKEYSLKSDSYNSTIKKLEPNNCSEKTRAEFVKCVVKHGLFKDNLYSSAEKNKELAKESSEKESYYSKKAFYNSFFLIFILITCWLLPILGFNAYAWMMTGKLADLDENN